jgi:hypothetical protein
MYTTSSQADRVKRIAQACLQKGYCSRSHRFLHHVRYKVLSMHPLSSRRSMSTVTLLVTSNLGRSQRPKDEKESIPINILPGFSTSHLFSGVGLETFAGRKQCTPRPLDVAESMPAPHGGRRGTGVKSRSRLAIAADIRERVFSRFFVETILLARYLTRECPFAPPASLQVQFLVYQTRCYRYHSVIVSAPRHQDTPGEWRHSAAIPSSFTRGGDLVSRTANLRPW